MGKKILFVTHALESLYGAATSLRLVLENYSGVEADLLLPRSLRHPRNLAETAARFASVRRAYEISMPVDLSLVGIQRGLADTAHGIAHWLAWQRDRIRYRQLLADNAYDIVHFNSPILHKMVMPDVPAITHMRDIILDPGSPVIDKLANGKGIIFIDAATRQPFERRETSMHAITLNNPIDMRDMARAKVLSHPRLGPATTVFSMIGRISKIKGVDLVIAGFRQGAGDDALLFLVGDGPEDYVSRCRALAENDPRIVFWGEEADINQIYAITDYVVRGDPQPCIGRTIYEGLYAGCRVIMPGPVQQDLIFESEKFGNSVLVYTAGNRSALALRIEASIGKKVQSREFRSNVSNYVHDFDSFINLCISQRKVPTE